MTVSHNAGLIGDHITEDAPGWFRRALAQPLQNRQVTVSGTDIHYLLWQDDDHKPGLIFVHGNGAHAQWWRFIAPFFTSHYRVAALDLSGAGNSGYRDEYTPEAVSYTHLTLPTKSIV